MKDALLPMNMGEILDRSFQIYRGKFLAFVGIAAFPALVMMAVSLADSLWLHLSAQGHAARPGANLGRTLLVTLGYYHISSLFGCLFTPAFVTLASRLMHGEEGTTASSLRFAAADWRTYLWAGFLKLTAQLLIPELLMGLLALLGAILGVALGVHSGGYLAVLIFFLPGIAITPLFFWWGISFACTVPACALEGVTGTKALRRSWDLTKNSRMRILVAWALLAILQVTLLFSAFLLFRWIAAFFYPGHHLPLVQQPSYIFARALLNALVSAVVAPLYPIALTLFYYDQRIRKEGYDIERMMEMAGMNGPAALRLKETPAALSATGESLG